MTDNNNKNNENEVNGVKDVKDIIGGKYPNRWLNLIHYLKWAIVVISLCIFAVDIVVSLIRNPVDSLFRLFWLFTMMMILYIMYFVCYRNIDQFRKYVDKLGWHRPYFSRKTARLCLYTVVVFGIFSVLMIQMMSFVVVYNRKMFNDYVNSSSSTSTSMSTSTSSSLDLFKNQNRPKLPDITIMNGVAPTVLSNPLPVPLPGSYINWDEVRGRPYIDKSFSSSPSILSSPSIGLALSSSSAQAYTSSLPYWLPNLDISNILLVRTQESDPEIITSYIWLDRAVSMLFTFFMAATFLLTIRKNEDYFNWDQPHHDFIYDDETEL